MTGHELSIDQMTYLLGVASRHHRNQIAGWLSLTAHTRQGELYFKDATDVEIPIADVFDLLQRDSDVQRWAYNLYMNYVHFG